MHYWLYMRRDSKCNVLSGKSSKPAVGASKVFVVNICRALFQQNMLTLYQPIVVTMRS